MLEMNVQSKGTIPLEKLGELLSIRAAQLNRSVKDSCIAAMINVLISVRKMTLKAKLNAKTSPKVELQSQYIPSFASKKGEKVHIPCLRDSSGQRITPNLPVRWTEKSGKFKNLKVYLVTPEYKKNKPYLVVAKSESVARKFEDAKVKRRIRKYRGLAKHAFTLLQRKLHAESSMADSAGDGEKINEVAEKIAETQIEESENSCRVEVKDNLDYAMLAIKGGQTAIDDSVKKAANKVAGLITRTMKRHGISKQWKTPFPEVKQRK